MCNELAVVVDLGRVNGTNPFWPGKLSISRASADKRRLFLLQKKESCDAMNWVGPKRKTATETINVMITDIVTELALHGLDSLATQILALLDTPDLKTCQLVNKTWFQLIDELLRHDQHQRLAQSWKRNRAVLEQIQCHKVMT